MRAALWLVLAGCFKPTYHDGLACASDGWCPPPQRCGNDGFCHLTAPPDARPDTPSSGPPNFAFVTSGARPLSDFADRSELDAWCGQLATAAHLPGTYVAWLSTSTSNAKTRLAGIPGWVRADGETFATSVDDMVAGKMYAPLRIDETGTDQGDVVVGTATDTDGTYTMGEACFGVSGTGGVDFGFAHAGKNWWTHTGNFSQVGCGASAHYYCFETDKNGAAPMPAHTGKLAFLSNGTINGGQGLATGMDTLCKSEGPPGRNFVAMVGNGIGSGMVYTATDRSVPNTVRPDGVWFTDNTNTIVAPLDVTLGGTYIDAPVWAGAMRSDAPPATDGSEDCSGWTSPASTVNGRTGSSAQTSAGTFGNGGTLPCNNALRIYCVEQ